MLYRPYAPPDFTQLYAIEEVCFKPPHRFNRSYMRQLVSSARAAAWVAEEGDRLTGFAIVEWTQEIGGVVAYIQTIEVAPEWRGCGVGRELLRRVEQSAHAASAGAIWLHVDAENRPAIALYQRDGYLCEGKVDDYYGRGRAGLIFLKDLKPRGIDSEP